MRQKVGFARALAVEPELLCLDEPFSALDVLSADALRGELLELWTSGTMPTKAILMVTHNIEEAVWLADRIVVMQKEPGRVVTELEVSLPYPRRRKSLPFLELVDHVYAILAGQTQPEYIEMGTAPGEAGRTRALPHTTINELAGLLEHLHEAPQHRADIYQLAKDLKVELNALLPLTEAAELLGFATIAEGDIALTALGETFAEASIQARKEIFATRIRRLPLFNWLLAMLQAADTHQLEKDVLTTASSSTSHRRRPRAKSRSSSTGAAMPNFWPTTTAPPASTSKATRPLSLPHHEHAVGESDDCSLVASPAHRAPVGRKRAHM
jgi:NitT/TauT family transport system ATP-binding protein